MILILDETLIRIIPQKRKAKGQDSHLQDDQNLILAVKKSGRRVVFLLVFLSAVGKFWEDVQDRTRSISL